MTTTATETGRRAPLLEIHLIHDVPPSCINRDQNGSPKHAYYGGERRVRVSSQAWKRPARFYLQKVLDDGNVATRDTVFPQIVADRLVARAPQLAEHKDAIGAAAASAVFGVKFPKGGKKESPRPVTQYLLFYGERQLDTVVDLLVAAADELRAADGHPDKIAKAVGELGLEAVYLHGHSAAVALQGAMIADNPGINVDGALQVAHAISTHAAEIEADYYTAIDDRSEESGATMIGRTEFNSATLYRYACIDLGVLARNLDGDMTHAVNVAAAYVEAFTLSMPTGKQNAFGHQSRPQLTLLTVRDDRPVNLVTAFERPVYGGLNGLSVTSAVELVRHWREADELYGTPPLWAQAAATASYSELVAKQLSHGQMPTVTGFGQLQEDLRAVLLERA